MQQFVDSPKLNNIQETIEQLSDENKNIDKNKNKNTKSNNSFEERNKNQINEIQYSDLLIDHLGSLRNSSKKNFSSNSSKITNFRNSMKFKISKINWKKSTKINKSIDSIIPKNPYLNFSFADLTTKFNNFTEFLDDLKNINNLNDLFDSIDK